MADVTWSQHRGNVIIVTFLTMETAVGRSLHTRGPRTVFCLTHWCQSRCYKYSGCFLTVTHMNSNFLIVTLKEWKLFLTFSEISATFLFFDSFFHFLHQHFFNHLDSSSFILSSLQLFLSSFGLSFPFSHFILSLPISRLIFLWLHSFLYKLLSVSAPLPLSPPSRFPRRAARSPEADSFSSSE